MLVINLNHAAKKTETFRAPTFISIAMKGIFLFIIHLFYHHFLLRHFFRSSRAQHSNNYHDVTNNKNPTFSNERKTYGRIFFYLEDSHFQNQRSIDVLKSFSFDIRIYKRILYKRKSINNQKKKS